MVGSHDVAMYIFVRAISSSTTYDTAIAMSLPIALCTHFHKGRAAAGMNEGWDMSGFSDSRGAAAPLRSWIPCRPVLDSRAITIPQP